MDRDMTADVMVRLPRTNAASAAVMAEQLLTVADAEKGGGLPLLIERPRARMASALVGLTDEIKPQEAVDTLLCKAADTAVDGAWRSLFDWTGSFAGIPDGSFPEQDKIRSLKATVFKEGLSFIILPFREEWVQSEARLNAMAEGGFEPVIEKLGGAPFLKNLKSAHARYGEVLGIKTAVKVEENPLIRKKMEKLLSAIKSYVLKVAAYADPEDAGSEILSTALLSPLSKWKDTARKNRDEAGSKPSDAVTDTSKVDSAH
jgi:hypothetical protein